MADTTRILSSGGTSVQVWSASIAYEGIDPVALTTTDSLVETATVYIFRKTGGFRKDAKGLVAEGTHSILFPYTSSVAVGHRIKEADESDYYEVLSVAPFEDHNEIDARKVENR